MTDKYTQYLINCIKEVGKKRKVKILQRIALLQCPNPLHKKGREDRPSLRVNLVKQGKHIAGSAHCFSCAIHFPNWKKVAEAIKRPDLISDSAIQEYEERMDNFFVSGESDIDDIVLGQGDEETTLTDLKDSLPWNENEDWRTVNGKLLVEVGAKFFFDTQQEMPMVYLPCMVNGREVGGIRANLEKRGKSNYFNTPGEWTFNLGLYPYDYVAKMLKETKTDTLVLEEGPRDALKSIQYGIPALAILGTGNWSDVKADLVASLPIKRVITALDPDEAGDRAKKLIYRSLKEELEIRNFSFAKQAEKYNLEEAVDPGSMPPFIAKKLRNLVKAEW